MLSREQANTLNSGLRTVSDILKSTDFSNHQEPCIHEAALALILINLKDVTQVLAAHGQRLNFTDDLDPGTDITSQISSMRNAICHLGSASRRVDESGNRLSFGRAIGRCNLANINGVILGNPYADDIGFFYGKMRLLLVRHICRALHEALNFSSALCQEAGFPWHSVNDTSFRVYGYRFMPDATHFPGQAQPNSQQAVKPKATHLRIVADNSKG